MNNDIEERVHNIEVVVELLKRTPHTYETILQGGGSPTLQFILRRKLNNLCRQGIVFKSNIPGTRFGKCIFYTIPKRYFILVEAGRMGSIVYFFEEFDKVDKFHLKVKKFSILEGSKWIRKYNKIFNEGRILLFL